MPNNYYFLHNNLPLRNMKDIIHLYKNCLLTWSSPYQISSAARGASWTVIWSRRDCRLHKTRKMKEKNRGWNFKIATNASQIIEVLNAKALILETFPSKVSTVLYDHNRLLLIITFDNLDFLGKHNLITCPKEWTKNYGCEKAIPKHSFLKLDVIHFHPNVTQFPASSGRNCDLMKVILVRCVVTIKWFRMHNVMSGKNDF